MEGGDGDGTHPPKEAEGLQQFRMLLALVEQDLSDKRSRGKTTSPPVVVGADESRFQLRFIRDRRTETLTVLPFRDRRGVRSGEHE